MAIYLGENEVSLAGTNGGFMLNGRLIATKEYELKLSDTNFSSLTVSTTAQTLTLPATTYTTTASTSITCLRVGEAYDGTIIDRSQYDYVIFFEAVTTYAYSSTVAGTIHGIRSVYTRDLVEGKYHNTINSTTGQLTTATTSGTSYITSTSRLLYQKADDTYALSTTNYGFYCAPTPAAFGVTSGKDYINLNLASTSIRGNATYFPVESIELLDPANTKMLCRWYIYEGDKSMYGQIFSRATELAANT